SHYVRMPSLRRLPPLLQPPLLPYTTLFRSSTAATAQLTARSRMRSAKTSRRSGSICLLSLRPRTGESGERITAPATTAPKREPRSEEHTSELQSRVDLVCRLLLEKKKHNER